jgi:hypothetical protein
VNFWGGPAPTQPTMAADEGTKLARLEALRAEVAALESELGVAAPTYGFTRDETYAMALPRGADPYYLLPAEERDAAAAIEGPLNGVTVLDLTRILAGPHCTKMLMDMGARIIKVEHPDPTGVASGDTRPAPEYFAATSHGKESVAIDLKDEAGKAQLHALLVTADVIIENYRPGVMDRLGFGWETLHAQYPRLVMCSISGFGQSGPASMRPAMDTVAQALSGLMSITGVVENEPHGHGANRCVSALIKRRRLSLNAMMRTSFLSQRSVKPHGGSLSDGSIDRAVLCCAVLCCAVLCCAVLCCAVLCCAVLCCVWHGIPDNTCQCLVRPSTSQCGCNLRSARGARYCGGTVLKRARRAGALRRHCYG